MERSAEPRPSSGFSGRGRSIGSVDNTSTIYDLRSYDYDLRIYEQNILMIGSLINTLNPLHYITPITTYQPPRYPK